MDAPLLASLTDADRRDLLTTARRRKFRRREIIFHEGDPGESLHLVVAGHVALRITTPLGDVATVRVVGPGDFFGELALLTPGPRSATAVAVESAETLSLSRDNFNDLRQRSPSTHEAVTAGLATEIRRLAAALLEALYLPVEKRLWRRLVDLAASYGGGATVMPFTQDEVAQLAGTTRPTANRLLREGEAAGAIALSRGNVEITDLDWVQRRAR